MPRVKKRKKNKIKKLENVFKKLLKIIKNYSSQGRPCHIRRANVYINNFRPKLIK